MTDIMDSNAAKVPRVEQDLRILGLCRRVQLLLPGQHKPQTVWISKQEATKLIQADNGYTITDFGSTDCTIAFIPRK